MIISVLSVSKCTKIIISRVFQLQKISRSAPLPTFVVRGLRAASHLSPDRHQQIPLQTRTWTRWHRSRNTSLLDPWNPWVNLALIIHCSQSLIDCPSTFLSSKTASLVSYLTWPPQSAESHTPWFQVWRAEESANRPYVSESTASGHCNEVQKGTWTARNRSIHSILYFCMVRPVSVHCVYVRNCAQVGQTCNFFALRWLQVRSRRRNDMWKFFFSVVSRRSNFLKTYARSSAFSTSGHCSCV